MVWLLAAALPSFGQQAPDLLTKAVTTLSQTRGTIRLAGLQKPVQVLRDRWGVPHIYAQNSHDLFFAQGFVVAQDRLFQMELWKRSGQGRLAEVLGPSALQRDVNARRLLYRGDMKAEYESYSPDAKEILQAFTEGINAYITTRKAADGPGLPVEFQLAGFAPENWKPEDCLNRMAAYGVMANADSELQHAQVVGLVGAAKASQLFALDPQVTLDPAPGVDFSGLGPELLGQVLGSDARIEFPNEGRSGSNNWAVSGTLTASGKPILANDPHRVIAEPSLRYMVHLVAPGWDVIGATEPGLPGVALGHNEQIAWGFTIFPIDQQDLYVEELNPANSLQYRTAAGWEAMQVRRESFAIRGAAAVTLDLKFTRHGPVLWDDGKRALALRWVGAEPGTAGYLASLAVDRAHTWAEFEDAMARWKVPPENIVYADREGNIGEHSIALAPLRKNWTGLLPVPGTGGYEWAGFIAPAELPRQLNPKEGYVATANNRVTADDYPYHIGFEWYPEFRLQRIREVLDGYRASGKKIGNPEMERLQTDVHSVLARQLQQMLRAQGWAGSDHNAQRLLAWDCVLGKESPAAALYEMWLQELTVEIERRAFPSSMQNQLEDNTHLQVLRYLTHPTASVFGANPETGRDRVLREALQRAGENLAQRQGPDPESWSWGELHVALFRHALDKLPGAAGLVDLGPTPRPGDDTTVNATEHAFDSFVQTSGASYRQILDTSDWDRSEAVNAPGQSGQPGSSHYFDLVPLWNDGQYFPLVYSREAVERETVDRLELQP